MYCWVVVFPWPHGLSESFVSGTSIPQRARVGLHSTGSTFLGLSGSVLACFSASQALICEMNDYSRKKKRPRDCLLSSNKWALLKMKKDTLELKVILLWRKHLSVGKPFLDCIGPESSLAPELVLSWAIAYFIAFIFLFPRLLLSLAACQSGGHSRSGEMIF